MRKHYPWLLFDADGTLFDYNRAEVTALRKTFESFNLPFEDEYLDVYQRINHGLWQALEKQEIKQDVLRVRRFELLSEALKIDSSPDEMSTMYVKQMGLCADLIDGAYDILQALHGRCKLAIVTNGLQAVQRSRLAHSQIRDFIADIIISEEIGAAKPHVEFFDIAFERLAVRNERPVKSDVLIIGDSLSSDIKGGANYGIDTCWYNPTAEPRPDSLPITYEIRDLHELLDVID